MMKNARNSFSGWKYNNSEEEESVGQAVSKHSAAVQEFAVASENRPDEKFYQDSFMTDAEHMQSLQNTKVQKDDLNLGLLTHERLQEMIIMSEVISTPRCKRKGHGRNFRNK